MTKKLSFSAAAKAGTFGLHHVTAEARLPARHAVTHKALRPLVA
jgi:hypothetical protein